MSGYGAQMDYLIEHDPLEHAHLVTASGELDVAAAPQLSAILTMGAASSQSVVVLDMGGARSSTRPRSAWSSVPPIS